MRRTQLTIAGFEDWEKGQEPRNAGSFQKLEKEKKELFPQSLQKKNSALPAPRIEPRETYLRSLTSKTTG